MASSPARVGLLARGYGGLPLLVASAFPGARRVADGGGSPLTVAGPRRSRTGFPVRARRGHPSDVRALVLRRGRCVKPRTRGGRDAAAAAAARARLRPGGPT